MTWMTIPAFLVAIGVLVVVHEYGHYLVARACGVKVLRFSFGFGRVLFSRRLGRDGTEWALSAFPLGGYVKMLDEREGDVAPHETARAFNRQSVWKRILIVAAGPCANFLLAIVLYAVVYMHGMPSILPVIGAVAADSPAAAARLQPGDIVTRVGEKPVTNVQEARLALIEYAASQRPVTLDIEKDGRETVQRTLDLSGLRSAELDGDFMRAIGILSFQPPLPPVVGEVNPTGAAQLAGVQAGDRIVAIDGTPIADWSAMVAMVGARPGQPLAFEIERAGARVALTIAPNDAEENGRHIGRIGVSARIDEALLARYQIEVRYGAGESIARAVDMTWGMSVLSLRLFGKMLVGQISIKNLSGPITIATTAGQAAHAGWLIYASFLAFVSISLGVLNLLPVPLLDGGHLMYYMVEIFKGSPVSDKAMEFGQRVGMALLFVLMTFALYNDITRHIFRG